MQVTERVERALIDYLRMVESSPTESGDLEARAASMARNVAGLLTSKPGKTSVMTVDGVPIIRVRLRSSAGQRTVTAGIDAFSQLMDSALNEMPRRLVSGAISALFAIVSAEVEKLNQAVLAKAEVLTSDLVMVKKWQDRLAADREEKIRIEREDLVSRMSSLLLGGGWTLEMLNEAVNAATCHTVMSA